MPFAPDSTEPGYLDMATETLEGDPFVDFLQAVIVGVLGLPPELVRPRWQPQPPLSPKVSTDWCAVGVTEIVADFEPYMQHVGDGDGHDILRRQEQVTVLCSFYGPHSDALGGHLRDGLYIDQNRAAFRANAVGIIEIGNLVRASELFREQWRGRTDLELHLRREVRRRYEVRNLLRSTGPIIGEDISGRVVEMEFDTDDVP